MYMFIYIYLFFQIFTFNYDLSLAKLRSSMLLPSSARAQAKLGWVAIFSANPNTPTTKEGLYPSFSFNN